MKCPRCKHSIGDEEQVCPVCAFPVGEFKPEAYEDKSGTEETGAAATPSAPGAPEAGRTLRTLHFNRPVAPEADTEWEIRLDKLPPAGKEEDADTWKMRRTQQDLKPVAPAEPPAPGEPSLPAEPLPPIEPPKPAAPSLPAEPLPPIEPPKPAAPAKPAKSAAKPAARTAKPKTDPAARAPESAEPAWVEGEKTSFKPPAARPSAAKSTAAKAAPAARSKAVPSLDDLAAEAVKSIKTEAPTPTAPAPRLILTPPETVVALGFAEKPKPSALGESPLKKAGQDDSSEELKRVLQSIFTASGDSAEAPPPEAARPGPPKPEAPKPAAPPPEPKTTAGPPMPAPEADVRRRETPAAPAARRAEKEEPRFVAAPAESIAEEPAWTANVDDDAIAKSEPAAPSKPVYLNAPLGRKPPKAAPPPDEPAFVVDAVHPAPLAPKEMLTDEAPRADVRDIDKRPVKPRSDKASQLGLAFEPPLPPEKSSGAAAEEEMEVHVVVAGFARRLLAGFIDHGVTLALAWIFLALGFAAYGRALLPSLDASLFYPLALARDYPILAPAYGALYLFLFALMTLYFTTLGGRTPGKLAMDLEVIQTDGEPLSIGRAAIRLVGSLVAALPFFIGLLWVSVDAKKQGLHDKLAQTLVVRLHPASGPAEEEMEEEE
ncbi:MAG: RDD family protein [Myxococcales bacterium]|nr:MAG: RDD family protein [Myxococcales bacterium]